MVAGSPQNQSPSPANAPAGRLRLAPKDYLIGAAIALVVIVGVVALVRFRGGNERRQYESVLKTSLDKIVTAQEGFYYDSTRYVGSLRALPTVELPVGVHVQLFNPNRRSWWGIATHDRLPAHHCVVWVGSAPTSLPLEARAPENETKPLCFDDASTASPRTRPS